MNEKQSSANANKFSYHEADSEHATNIWTVRRTNGKLETSWIEIGRGTKENGDMFVRVMSDRPDGSQLEKDIPLAELEAIRAARVGKGAVEIVASEVMAPSATQQIAQNGIIDRVPGATIRSPEPVEVTPVARISNSVPELIETSAAEVASLTVQERIDALVRGLGGNDRAFLQYYANALKDKREAQQDKRGQDSIAAGQRAGQYYSKLTDRAQRIASQYVTLESQL